MQVDTGAQGGRPDVGLLRRGQVVEPAPELGVARVDGQQLTGLGVLDHDDVGGGQFQLTRIGQAERHQLVALAEEGEGPLPARVADEVGDDHDHRTPADDAVTRTR